MTDTPSNPSATTSATDDQVEELVKAFDALSGGERLAVLRLAKSLARLRERNPRGVVVAPRGFARCADCGETAMCYARRGIMRCSHCRRKLAFKEEP